MRSALMPAFSNKGATFFKYTSLASPFLLLGFITTFSLRGLLGIPKQEKKKKKKKPWFITVVWNFAWKITESYEFLKTCIVVSLYKFVLYICDSTYKSKKLKLKIQDIAILQRVV